MKKILMLTFSILIFILGCQGSYNNVSHKPSVSGDIEDNSTWYADMNNNVLKMSVSIPTPNSSLCAPYNNPNGQKRACTLEDIDHDTNPYDDYNPKLNVRMSTPDFIPANEQTNASLNQKGKSTRDAIQKSYRIKLDSKTELYEKQRTFQLNKHAFDNSRIRNKFAFDFFIDIPNFTSLKTQFVHLNIDGKDYGLFTDIEKEGKEYLINRGWNPNDNLYKAQNFDFRYSPELALDSSGHPVNLKAFNSKIEVERGKKQTKLIEMIKAIDEAKTDKEFEQVFNRYFNRNNYITWLAVNIIFANKDTISQNFFLFNPLYSDTFYFTPWDYDDSSHPINTYPKWQLGLSLWWDIPLHKKFIKIKKNRDDVLKMVKDIRAKYVTDAIIKQRLDTYRPVIEHYVKINPDLANIHLDIWEKEYKALYTRIGENVKAFTDNIGSPMPFWQGANYVNGILNLTWGRAVDLESDKIVYEVKIADNVNMQNPIIDEQNVQDIPTKKGDNENIYYSKDINLSNGKYYMKVIASEENNTSSYQIAFDTIQLNLKDYVFGVLEFEVK